MRYFSFKLAVRPQDFGSNLIKLNSPKPTSFYFIEPPLCPPCQPSLGLSKIRKKYCSYDFGKCSSSRLPDSSEFWV